MVDGLICARVLRPEGWRVRRAWPRSPEHLLLDLVDEHGAATAGQWFADADRAARTAAATPGARPMGSVVLQPNGGDRRLPAVSDLLRQDRFRLVSHRPERRAVLAAPEGFVKVVRPARHAEMVGRARLAEAYGLGAPSVLAEDPAVGTMTTAVLPGRTLTDVLRGPDAAAACRAGGRALARLHATEIPARVDLGEHGAAQEWSVLRRWTDLATAYGLLTEADCGADLTPSGRRTLIHRDLHDGQLIIDADGTVGVLDFDLLTVGDPALDLANLLAHLELRARQGVLSDPASAITATLEGYRPDAEIREALPGYLAVSQERLRAVYAFRDPDLVS